MILVILVIGILMIALGTVLYDKLDCGKDEIGTIFQIVGTVATIISTIVSIVLLICVLTRVNIDKKIVLYEEENAKIEQQIADTVKQYQEYATIRYNNRTTTYDEAYAVCQFCGKEAHDLTVEDMNMKRRAFALSKATDAN